MNRRMILTVHGHVVGSAAVNPDKTIYDVEFLPDSAIPEEARPYLKMITAMTLEHISIKED